MVDFPVTERNRVQRLPDRASYDRDLAYAIFDEALYCHVAFVRDGQPFIIPTLHARMGETVVLHGARASRLIKHVQAGEPVSIAVTLLDGLVMARSAFHHSLNYRSAVCFGRGRSLDTDAEKLAALEAITEHLAAGRWADVRPPSPRELNATAVVAIAIESASAKMRSGPPGDDAEDYELPIWAGVVPLAYTALPAQPDTRLAPDIPLPAYLAAYRRPQQQ